MRQPVCLRWCVLWAVLTATWCKAEDGRTPVDKQGYLVFCPCMGRFGNQMDYLLGSLGFARELNRTLVLPAWVEYRRHQPNSTQVPFDEYLRVDSVAEYHRVITMEKFMSELAPSVWPPDQRIAFCYQERRSYGGQTWDACASKSGNPPGPFWDHYGIDFVGSELHAPLLYDLWNVPGEAARWRTRYPPHQWPVLAFAGAPASYPVLQQNAGIQHHFRWSEAVTERAATLRQRLPKAPLVAIHLRIGSDWVRACEHVPDTPGNLFSSAQCLGYRREHGTLTEELCLPSWRTVARQLRRAARNLQAVSVYVATDAPDRIHELRQALGTTDLSVVSWPETSELPADPHVELALLARANVFIGNCVSSFTAVVKRERDALGLPSLFWAFPDQPERKRRTRVEL